MNTLQPICSACYNFVVDGTARRATVIIKPGVIRQVGDEQRISWFCSLGKACENEHCEHCEMGRRDKSLALTRDKGL